MFELVMKYLQKISVALGSRSMEYYVDTDAYGPETLTIWRKRHMYACHLKYNAMEENTMAFAWRFGYTHSEVEYLLIQGNLHRAWKKKNINMIERDGYDYSILKYAVLLMYIYQIIRYPFNYFYSFFINLENVEAKDMFYEEE